MSAPKKIHFGYFNTLPGAAALNYIPGLTDAQVLAFGIFALWAGLRGRPLASTLPLRHVTRGM